jgi:hypothetical protein
MRFRVRCAFFDRNSHSRMPLSFTPLLRLSDQACDQWHSFLVSTFLTGSHCKLRPNTEGEDVVINSEYGTRWIAAMQEGAVLFSLYQTTTLSNMELDGLRQCRKVRCSSLPNNQRPLSAALQQSGWNVRERRGSVTPLAAALQQPDWNVRMRCGSVTPLAAALQQPDWNMRERSGSVTPPAAALQQPDWNEARVCGSIVDMILRLLVLMNPPMVARVEARKYVCGEPIACLSDV